MNRLTLTTPRQTIVAVLAGALLTWLVLLLYDRLTQYPPIVPITVPIALAAVAVAGIVYGAFLPKRRQERTLSSQEGFIAVVSAKAMIFTGAVLAGGHAVYVMKYLPLVAADNPLRRVVLGAGTIVAGLLLAWAGTFVEKRLVVDDPPDDSDPDQSPANA